MYELGDFDNEKYQNLMKKIRNHDVRHYRYLNFLVPDFLSPLYDLEDPFYLTFGETLGCLVLGIALLFFGIRMTRLVHFLYGAVCLLFVASYIFDTRGMDENIVFFCVMFGGGTSV